MAEISFHGLQVNYSGKLSLKNILQVLKNRNSIFETVAQTSWRWE